MKRHLATLVPLAATSILLTSCGGDFLSRMNDPLPGSGNALDPPGFSSGDPVQVVEVTGPTYAPGEWVETAVPQAALYARDPKPGDQPAYTLKQGTPLKVVSTSGTYVKVELEEGRIGYVPAIMVSQKPSPNEIPIVPIGPEEITSPPPVIGGAPEPEVAPISVEDAMGVPALIDPETDSIE